MSGRLVVVSADPGVTTGWAVMHIPTEPLLAEGLVPNIKRMRLKCGQFNMSNTSENVDRFLAVGRAVYEEATDDEDYFVMTSEWFTLRMLSMDPTLLEPVCFNAVLKDRLRGTAQGVEWQHPVEAMTAITDQRLALWGLLDATRHVPDHGRDAVRHALLLARRFVADRRVRLRVGWSPPPPPPSIVPRPRYRRTRRG